MGKLKEVTVFSNGDSNKISTWSNVPFFFSKTLTDKGLKVNRVNIETNFFLRNIFDGVILRAINLFFRKNSFNYFRSSIHFVITRKKIAKAVKRFRNSDAFIFLTFSFSAESFTRKPIIQLCDWTFDHYVRYFANGKPNVLESRSIFREDRQINGSDLVFPLFPGIAEYMATRYKPRVVYLGNVVNSCLEGAESTLLVQKKNSQKILFIGSRKYIVGARMLLEAFILLKARHPFLTLHFVGLSRSDFQNIPEDVYCYGYLDKGNEADRNQYYTLLAEAKVFVNTSLKWSAFSASIEAMYFYIPVVIPPYDEFKKTFGADFRGGVYFNGDTSLELGETIASVMFCCKYEQLSKNAHDLVKNFTWSVYVDKLIKEIEQLNK